MLHNLCLALLRLKKDFFREQEYEKSFIGWREGSLSNQNPEYGRPVEDFCAKFRQNRKNSRNLFSKFPSSDIQKSSLIILESRVLCLRQWSKSKSLSNEQWIKILVCHCPCISGREDFLSRNFAKIEKIIEICFPSFLAQTFKSHL